jgi:hypothetical protein
MLPQIPCFREFLREFLKNVRQETGKPMITGLISIPSSRSREF